jgi:hypothetical protein
MIFDYIENLQNQIGTYFLIIRVIIYFIVGALILFLINKMFKLFKFFTKIFNKESLKQKIYLILKFFLFIVLSAFIGWIFIDYII